MSDFCTSSLGKPQPNQKMKYHCLLEDTPATPFAKQPRLPVEHDGISTAYPRLTQTCSAACFGMHMLVLAYWHLTKSLEYSPSNTMQIVLSFHGIS
jgi:hypothetical protein